MTVLRLFAAETRDLAMVDVARHLGRPATTVSRWLRDMAAAGFLERDPDSGRYRLGRALTEIAGSVDTATRVRRVCRAAAEALAKASGETTYIGMREGRGAVLVDGVASAQRIRLALTIGERVELHASATGKCLLAWLPEREARALLPDVLHAATPRTLTSREALARDLAAIRTRGYAVSKRELEDDLVAVAAPVHGADGRIVAALSVGGPASRVTDRILPDLGRLTMRVASGASRSLGAPTPPRMGEDAGRGRGQGAR